MYSPKLQKLIKNIPVYSKISVKTKNQTYKGILMPRSGLGDSSYLVLKLDNGYNIGVYFEPNMEIKQLSKPVKIPTLKLNMIKSEGKKPVSIITTGGTITSKVDYKTGGVTSLAEPREILNAVPELSKFISLSSVESPFTRMSESVNYEDWIELAKITHKKLKQDEGVIITHGTDTLHYTSAALSFMLDTQKPVVLTGSQRSSDRGSSDGAQNLICSSVAASSEIAETGVCMHATSNDNFCYFTNGAKVRKMHTSRRDTFRPVNTLPYASVYPNGDIEKISDYKKRANKKLKIDTKYDPYISLIKFHPGAYPKVIDWYVKEGAKGIIIEATGLGQIALNTRSKEYSWEHAIKNAIESGVFIGFAPQTLYGSLNMNVYSEGRQFKELGVTNLKDMLPETALVKLGFVLGHTKNLKKISQEMLKNYSGEISERILPETFLY